MKDVMVLDQKTKRNIGIICGTPLTLFTLILIYWLALVSPLMDGNAAPGMLGAVTSQNYGALVAMLAIGGTISAGVLIYCLVLLARLRNLNSAEKLLWLLFLCTFVPVACFLFWMLLIRKEPYNVPVYPNMD